MTLLQILESWRSKRVIDPQKVDDVMAALDSREDGTDASEDATGPPVATLPRHEVFKRIEEDRERHKRLRERRWVQPVSHNPNSTQLASFLPLTDDGDGDEELTLDIEFENDWEATSDWNEDDDDAAQDENELCFPRGQQPMDLS